MRVFLLLAASMACLITGMNFQLVAPTPINAPEAMPVRGLPPSSAPIAPPTLHQDTVLPPVVGFNQQTEAERLKQRREAEAFLDKPGPKLPEAGDDELRKLLIARYNAAFAEVKVKEAVYKNGTAPFESNFEAQKRLVQAELELSDKPADQIAALENQLEMTKQVELKVKALSLTYSRGGEADKYYLAKFMRLDAEIQLLRAKRKLGLAK